VNFDLNYIIKKLAVKKFLENDPATGQRHSRIHLIMLEIIRTMIVFVEALKHHSYLTLHQTMIGASFP